jgi:hypothetical protein
MRPRINVTKTCPRKGNLLDVDKLALRLATIITFRIEYFVLLFLKKYLKQEKIYYDITLNPGGLCEIHPPVSPK